MASLEQLRHQLDAPHYDKDHIYGATAKSDHHPNQDALWPWVERGSTLSLENSRWPFPPFEYLMRGRLYVVADGITNCTDGSKASREAVRQIAENYYLSDPSRFTIDSTDDDIKSMLRTAIIDADRSIRQEFVNKYPGKSGPTDGWYATCVCVLIRGNKLYVANVGDSRAYLLSPQANATQLTIDHENITRANAVSQAMGDGEVKPAIGGPYELEAKNRILLCTDGLYKIVGGGNFENWIRNYLEYGQVTPGELPKRLVNEAITQYASEAAKQGKQVKDIDDDVTVVVFDYQPLASPPVKDDPEFDCWWSSNYSGQGAEWVALVEHYNTQLQKGGDGASIFRNRMKRLAPFSADTEYLRSKTKIVSGYAALAPGQGKQFDQTETLEQTEATRRTEASLPGEQSHIQEPVTATPEIGQNVEPYLPLQPETSRYEDELANQSILETRKLIDELEGAWQEWSMTQPVDPWGSRGKSRRDEELYAYLGRLLSRLKRLNQSQKTNWRQDVQDVLVDLRTHIRLVVTLLAAVLKEDGRKYAAEELYDDNLWPDLPTLSNSTPEQIYQSAININLDVWRDEFYQTSLDYRGEVDTQRQRIKAWVSKNARADRQRLEELNIQLFQLVWCIIRWLEPASESEADRRASLDFSPGFDEVQVEVLTAIAGKSQDIIQKLDQEFTELPKLKKIVTTR